MCTVEYHWPIGFLLHGPNCARFHDIRERAMGVASKIIRSLAKFAYDRISKQVYPQDFHVRPVRRFCIRSSAHCEMVFIITKKVCVRSMRRLVPVSSARSNPPETVCIEGFSLMSIVKR